MKTMKSWISATFALVSILLLAACGGGGGGGGGGGTTTPPPPVPTITISSFAPANGATGVATDVKITFVYNYTDATSFTVNPSDYTISCNSVNVAATSAVSNDTTKHQVTVTLTPTAALPYKANCTVGLNKVAATGAGGSANSLPANTSFTEASIACVSPQVPDSTGTSCVTPVVAWWPQTFAAIGTKVTTPTNRLPSTVQNVGDAGWQQAVRDGNIKFIDTGLVLTGYSTRPIVFAHYLEPVNGYSCTRAVYKDDGSIAGLTSVSAGCTTSPSDWADGTSVGAIRHFPAYGCYQMVWNQTRLDFDDNAIACPF